MKFYLPIIFLLLSSITSVHRESSKFNSFLQSQKFFPHKDFSVVMQLPDKEEKSLTLTFSRITEQGIILSIPKNEKLKEEYSPYFQKDNMQQLLIPFPYIRGVLSENHGHEAKNLHLKITPNRSIKMTRISIYFPKNLRLPMITKVKKGFLQFLIIAYSIQLHSRLQMFNNQFKNNCNPIKNEENLKKHLLVLIQRSINVRAELDKIKQYKEELKTRPGKQPPNLQSSYDYHSFKKTFFIEEVSGDCTVKANKTEVVIK